MAAKYWNRLGHERELWERGLTGVAGVDEAGCGPLAGPVVAAAVSFPSSWLETGLCRKLRGLNDSKQLAPEAREKFFCIITNHPDIRYAVARVEVEMIDQINIRQAAWRAMAMALEELQPPPEHVLVDGIRIRWLRHPQTALTDGDARSYTIAAASVLAKVTRDRIMQELDAVHPQYGFGEHKGYATPRHLAMLKIHGPCPVHRKSFLAGRANQIELFRLGDEPVEAHPDVSARA